MTTELIEILDTEGELDFDTRNFNKNNILDIRSSHCRSPAEYELFKYSSNYQTFKGGQEDLEMITGIEVISPSALGSNAY